MPPAVLLLAVRATVYYNPRCSTCRKVKAALEERGFELEVVEYLKGKVPRAAWAALVDQVGGDPTRLLRAREPLYKDLKLAERIAQGKVGREQVIDLLARFPQLLERPVVVTEQGKALVARPAERVRDL